MYLHVGAQESWGVLHSRGQDNRMFGQEHCVIKRDMCVHCRDSTSEGQLRVDMQDERVLQQFEFTMRVQFRVLLHLW